MEAMEFVMGTNLDGLPKSIDFNFEELKEALALSLAHYNGLVVTEDGIKAAKEDRAKLNKLREALENKRKEVKRECMAPYTDFEGKVKELVGLIDRPIAAIDSQLKDYEDRRRAAKRADIQSVYEELAGPLRDIIPFERLWRDDWYSVRMSTRRISEFLAERLKKASYELDILSTVDSEFMEPVKLKYIETLDLNAALAERARLQEQAARLREYEQTQMQEKTDAQPALSAPDRDDTQETCSADTAETEPETVYRLAFECQLTKAQAAALAKWLREQNINYRRI